MGVNIMKKFKTIIAALILSVFLLTGIGTYIPDITSNHNSIKIVYAAKRRTRKIKRTKAKKSYTVYITRTGHKYHRSGCRYLRRSKFAISLSNAIKEGYTPCSVCCPPRK